MARYSNNRGSRSRQQKRQANPPVAEFKAGVVKVAAWENEGEYGPYLSWQLTRSWKPDKGDWVNEKINLPKPMDLVAAIKALERALDDYYADEQFDPESDDDFMS